MSLHFIDTPSQENTKYVLLVKHLKIYINIKICEIKVTFYSGCYEMYLF